MTHDDARVTLARRLIALPADTRGAIVAAIAQARAGLPQPIRILIALVSPPGEDRGQGGEPDREVFAFDPERGLVPLDEEGHAIARSSPELR